MRPIRPLFCCDIVDKYHKNRAFRTKRSSRRGNSSFGRVVGDFGRLMKPEEEFTTQLYLIVRTGKVECEMKKVSVG